jgi:uncharacterized damage-inducible protein DinB
MRRQLILIAAGILLAGTVQAQQQQRPDPNDARGPLRFGFTEVTGWLVRVAESATTEQLAYRPVGTVRTLGQLVAHIADSHNYYCARASGQNVQWSDNLEKTVTEKAALVQALRRSIDACTPVYGGSTARLDQLMANLTHDHLHYGNIVTYLRMQGLTPPSS